MEDTSICFCFLGYKFHCQLEFFYVYTSNRIIVIFSRNKKLYTNVFSVQYLWCNLDASFTRLRLKSHGKTVSFTQLHWTEFTDKSCVVASMHIFCYNAIYINVTRAYVRSMHSSYFCNYELCSVSLKYVFVTSLYKSCNDEIHVVICWPGGHFFQKSNYEVYISYEFVNFLYRWKLNWWTGWKITYTTSIDCAEKIISQDGESITSGQRISITCYWLRIYYMLFPTLLVLASCLNYLLSMPRSESAVDIIDHVITHIVLISCSAVDIQETVCKSCWSIAHIISFSLLSTFPHVHQINHNHILPFTASWLQAWLVRDSFLWNEEIFCSL